MSAIATRREKLSVVGRPIGRAVASMRVHGTVDRNSFVRTRDPAQAVRVDAIMPSVVSAAPMIRSMQHQGVHSKQARKRGERHQGPHDPGDIEKTFRPYRGCEHRVDSSSLAMRASSGASATSSRQIRMSVGPCRS